MAKLITYCKSLPASQDYLNTLFWILIQEQEKMHPSNLFLDNF